MKQFLILPILLTLVSFCFAQVELDSGDLTKLVGIGEAYSKGVSLSETDLQMYRSPKFDRVIDTLLVSGQRDGSILDAKYLKRPSDKDLIYWYVIREIHYNRNRESKKPRPDLDVAKEILSTKIDPRWLLDNYYYRIRGGIASYFNEADLSKLDLRFADLGLTDPTEKAIFFFNVMEAVGGGRFMVLLATRNNKKILEFANRFPKFEGKKYYTFTDFSYPDFEWIGYEKRESYNQRHFETYYTTLYAHHKAETEIGEKRLADSLVRESILSKPEYFKFTSFADLLRRLS